MPGEVPRGTRYKFVVAVVRFQAVTQSFTMLRGRVYCVIIGCILEYTVCQDHFENVAFRKDCSMSSTHNNEHPAGYAVNGNTDGVYVNTQNCIHTSDADTSPWWQVNLGRAYPVHTITVWARDEAKVDLKDRMSYCLITVDGRECYRFGRITNNDSRKLTVTCTQSVLNGTVVRVSKDNRNAVYEGTINMCEFEVFSCSARYWGSGCNQVCGECRDGAPCDKVTGHCDSGCAKPWLRLPLCNGCVAGRWGSNCDKVCAYTCGLDGSCARDNGGCLYFCQPGWTGDPVCDQKCEPDKYGNNCSLTCGHCSNNATCRHDNGHCDNGCEDGYEGYRCQKPDENPALEQSTGTPAAGELIMWPIIVGAVLAAAAILLVAVVIVVWRIKKSRDQQKTSASNDNLHFSSRQQSSDMQFSNVAAADSCAADTTYELIADPAAKYDKLQAVSTTEDKPYTDLN